MAWRQLPDGSWFDPNTGNLSGLNGQREASARALSAKMSKTKLPPLTQRNQFPPLPMQKMIVLPGIKGPEAIIDPKRKVLALNPFELGMGMFENPVVKKIATTAAIAAGVGAVVWFTAKITKKKK